MQAYSACRALGHIAAPCCCRWIFIFRIGEICMESVCTPGTAPCFRERCNDGRMCNFNYYVPINGQLVMRFFSLHDSPHYPSLSLLIFFFFFFLFACPSACMRVLIAFGKSSPPRQVKYQHADAFSSFSVLFINGVSVFYFLSRNLTFPNCLFSKRGKISLRTDQSS